jgi:hypothetical protein
MNTPTMRAENYPSSSETVVNTASKRRGASGQTTQRNLLKYFSIYILLLLCSSVVSSAQSMSNYSGANFSATSGTYTALSGGTAVPALLSDEGRVNNLPIGFFFTYMGKAYNNFSVGSNGWLSLYTVGSTAAASSNGLSSGTAQERPVFAPYWDDLDGRALGAAASYITTGTVGTRVFTFEWLNWTRYNTSSAGSTPAISFQVKLYEATGAIEFVYREESGAFLTAPTASIGISGVSTGSGNYISLNGTSTTPTLSSTSETTTIATKPATGQTYTFTPPQAVVAPPSAGITFSATGSGTMTLNWTDGSTNETGFNVFRSIDNINFIWTSVVTSTSVATAVNAYTSVQTGLEPSTLYYWRVVANSEGVASTPVTGNNSTTAAATYYWVGSATAEFNVAGTWNTAADGSGTDRSAPNATDVLIIDGAGTTAGAAITGGTVNASATVGRLVISDNTSVSLAGVTSTRTITIGGGSGTDLDIQAGSTLTLNGATAVSILFSSTGVGLTGTIAGTLTIGGSTSNVVNTTGGSGTVVTVASTGTVNITISSNSVFVGSAATLVFANGSNCNSSGATTGAPPVPLATWGATSNLTVSGLTASSTAPSNNNQSFGNLIFNCPLNTGTSSWFTSLTTAVIKGDLTIQATGTGKFRCVTSGTLSILGNINVLGTSNFDATNGAGTVNLAGNFTHSSSGISLINASSTGGGTLNVGGNLNFSAGTLDLASSTTGTTGNGFLKVAGTFNQSGGIITETGTSTGSTIEFNGAAAQNVTLVTVNNRVNYRINNAAGISLLSDMPVNDLATVTFTSGKIGTGSNKLILFGGATSVGASNSTGYIVGNVQQNFPIGAGVSRTFAIGGATYAPATISFANVSTAGDLLLTTTGNDHPSLAGVNLRQDRTVNRYWSITNSGIAFDTYSASFGWESGDNDASLTGSSLRVAKFDSPSTWLIAANSGTPTSNSITTTNALTSFSDFAIAEACVPVEITSSATVLTCSTTSISLSASTADSYLWSNSETTSGINVTTAGTYTVTATYTASGCTSSTSVVITSNTTPPAVAITPSSGTLTCTTTSIALTASGADSYVWSGSGSGTNSGITASAAGVYTVTGTSTANGCTASTSVTIGSNTNVPVVAGAPTNPACNGAFTGAIDITVTGEPAATYAWTGPGCISDPNCTFMGGAMPLCQGGQCTTNIEDLTGLPAGAYSVVVTAANGCTGTYSTTLTAPAALSITPTITNVTCSGGADGSVSVVVTGGTGPYTYLWSNNSLTPSTGNVAAGTYSVTVTDANLCSAQLTGQVVGTINTTPVIATQNITGVCGSTTVDLSTGVTSTLNPGDLLQYSNDNFATSNFTNPIVGVAGTYYARVVSSAGCISASSPIVVNFLASATLTTTNLTGDCGTNTADLNDAITSDITGFTVEFFSNAGLSVSVPTPTAVSAGIYYVKVTDGGGCTASSPVTVSNPVYSSAPIVDGPICPGIQTITGTSVEADGTVITVYTTGLGTLGTTTVTGGVWSYTTLVALIAGDNLGATAQASGECGSASSVTVVVSPNVNAGTLSGASSLCVGQTSMFSSSGTPGGTWVSSNELVATVNPSGQVTATGVGTATITYEVNSGCGSPVDASKSITVTAPLTWYADTDGDLYGDPVNTLPACTQPVGYVADDNDCDDNDIDVNPDAVEICNGIDDDCDSNIDNVPVVTYYTDIDGDGFGDPGSPVPVTCAATTGLVLNDDDCDDGDSGINPFATEVINGQDDNCDGVIDNVGTPWYRDLDGDTYGNPLVVLNSVMQPIGYVADNSDCNDASAAINSAATEVCNTLDDDCNGQIDDITPTTYYVDVDQDGFGDPSSGIFVTCVVPPKYILDNSDCDDGDPLIYPGANEFCNGQDDDCNGQIDNGVLITWYADADGDSYGNPAVSQISCVAPFGYVNDNNDCDDTDNDVNPDAVEICNGIDDDCSGTIDDLVAELYYVDVDQDGFGDPASGVYLTCNIPSNFIQENSDCDDGDPLVYPGAIEICNQQDDDCDGLTDEGVPLPNPVCQNITVYLNAAGSATINPLMVDGGSSAACGILDRTIDISSFNCSNVGPNNLVLTITDLNNQTATCTAVVTVLDTIKPVIVGCPASFTATRTCAGSVTWTPPTASDICTVSSLTSNYAPGASFPVGTTTVTYTAVDPSGNTTTCSFDITIVPFTISMSGTPVSCFGESNGTASVTTASTQGAVTYLWNTGATTSSISGLVTGTYTVTVTNETCVLSNSFTVNTPSLIAPVPSITNVLCNGAATGSIALSPSGGVPGYTYLWSNGQTTATASGLVAGTYSVTITDATSCSVSATYTVTQLNAVSLSTTQVNVLCNGASTGSINLTVTGGTSPYTYSWSNGATTEDISGLAAGTYTVVVTDANGNVFGCTATTSATITSNSAVVITALQNNVTCNGLNNGSLALTVSGGVGPYTYLWSNGQTGASISSLATGTYTVTVTDGEGCTNARNYTITQPAPLAVAASITNVSCNGLSNGSATAVVSGGTSPYSYLWSNGQTTQTATGLASGSHTVTVTDNKGCVASFGITISQPAVIVVNAVVNNVLCNGGSGSIATVVTGGQGFTYTYLWSNGQTTATVSVPAGTYSVTVSDVSGCTRTNSFTVTQPSPLAVNLVSQVNVACFNGSTGSVQVEGAGGVAPYSYEWSGGQTTTQISSLIAGSYTVTVTDANGCTAISIIAITQPTPLSAGITILSNVTCSGGNNGSMQVNASGATAPYTYLWSNGQTSTLATGLTSGTHTVTVTDALGCTGTLQSTLVSPLAIAANITTTNINCNGGSNGTAAVAVTAGVAPYSFVWSTGQTTTSISGLVAGTYTVTVTDFRGCSASFPAIITQPNVVGFTAVVTNITCNNLINGSIAATPTGGTPGFTYLWSNGGTASTITGLSAGTYTLTVTDSKGCSRSAVAGTVVNPVVISLPTLVRTNVTCFGAANGTLTANPTGGTAPYSYLWSNGQTTQTAINLAAPATYTVTVTDANNCPSASRSSIISQPTQIVVSSTQVNVVCGGSATGSANATVTPTATYTFLWSNGATAASVSGLIAGTYTVTATNATGCTAVKVVTITQNPPIAVTFSGNHVSCFGQLDGSASALASGGVGSLTYLWSTGATTTSISGLAAGIYTLTVTDANSCSSSFNYTVTQPALLSSTSVVDSVNCNGGADGSIDLTTSGGTLPYTYLWNTGALSDDIAGLSAGIYTVTITDTRNCVSTQSFVVNQPLDLVVSGNVIDVNCFGPASGSISLTVNGGVPGYSYLWNTGATTSAISGLVQGSYSVTVTDYYGCTEIANFVVGQYAALSVNGVQTNVPCRNQLNGSVVLTVSGGATPYGYAWSNGQTGSTLSGVGAGTYSVTITDAVGCTVFQSYTITQPTAALTVFASITNANCFGVANGSAAAIVSGGTSPYSYLWSNGQTTQAVTGLAIGAYSVVVTDANACSSSFGITISQAAQINVSASISNATCFGTNGAISTVVTGGIGAYSYSWSSGQTTSSVSVPAGTYTVTATDGVGCSRSNNFTVTQPTIVVATIDSQVNVLCNGGATGAARVLASGGVGSYTYEWSTGQLTALATGLAAGTYTVTATDANSCSAVTTVIITQPPVFSGSITVLSNVACAGGSNGSLQANIGGATPPYTYLWSNGQTTSIATSLPVGTHTVTVTDAVGCSVVAQSTLAAPLAITANISTTAVNCNGGSNGAASVAVTAGVAPYSFIWSTGQTSTSLSGLIAGTYTVTVTDFRGCTASFPAIVTQPSALNFTTVVTNITCNNLNNGSIAATPTGGTPGYTYLWSNGGTASSISSLPAGTYTLTVTDSKGCIRTSAAGTIVNPAVISVPALVRTNVTCFGAANGTLTANPTGGNAPYSYLWSNGQTTQTAVGLAPASAGGYTVTVTDANGCAPIVRSNTLPITQPAQIVVSSTQVNVNCGGAATGSATATATPAATYTFLWSNGATTATVNGLIAGTYTVTATNTTGCTGTRTITITQPAPLVVTLTPTDVTCANNGSIASSVSGSTGPYTYLWSNAATTANISGLVAGTYTMTVTSSTGCTASQTTTIVKLNPMSIASFTPGNGNVGTVVTITGSGFTGTTAVRFGGTDAASFTVDNSNQITATVATGTLSGPIKVVRAACDSATSAASFLMPNITLNLKVYLQGYYLSGGLMTPAIFNQGVAGTTNTQADSITVELHSSTSPFATVYTAAPVMLSTSGNAVINMPYVYNGGSYYLVVKTRNHLATWSKFPVTLGGTTNFDFTTP